MLVMPCSEQGDLERLTDSLHEKLGMFDMVMDQGDQAVMSWLSSVTDLRM